MNKSKLSLNTLAVKSFSTESAAKPKGGGGDWEPTHTTVPPTGIFGTCYEEPIESVSGCGLC